MEFCDGLSDQNIDWTSKLNHLSPDHTRKRANHISKRRLYNKDLGCGNWVPAQNAVRAHVPRPYNHGHPRSSAHHLRVG